MRAQASCTMPVVRDVALPAGDDATGVVKPRKEPFDPPAPLGPGGADGHLGAASRVRCGMVASTLRMKWTRLSPRGAVQDGADGVLEPFARVRDHEAHPGADAQDLPVAAARVDKP